MRKWTADEINLFFTIIAKIKNTGVRDITFGTDDLNGLIKFNRRLDRLTNIQIAQLLYLQKLAQR